jgi:hypothetical protein
MAGSAKSLPSELHGKLDNRAQVLLIGGAAAAWSALV